MEKGHLVPEQKFTSPEEELHFLRGKVLQTEQELDRLKQQPEREKVIHSAVTAYKSIEPQHVLHPELEMHASHISAIALDLAPEAHDATMEELVTILQNKGIKNALQVVATMNNPHIEDDFHRFLVEYIKEGFPIVGLQEKSIIAKALRHTLYEVSLPDNESSNKDKPLKELISVMEQFYAGMLSVGEGDVDSSFSIELANSNGSAEFIFFVSVPDTKKHLFEKQLLSMFPQAKIIEKKDDYNIFNEQGASVASYATPSKNEAFTIRTYETFDADPLYVLLNTFSKISKEGEGAAVQMIIKPVGDYYLKLYKQITERIQKGESSKKALDIRHSFFGQLMKEAKETVIEIAGGTQKKEHKEPSASDSISIEQIKTKIAHPIVATNIRVVASAATEHRAKEILSDIESAYNQYRNTSGNGMQFKRVERKALAELLHDFAFRLYTDGAAVPLNIAELATVMHLPVNTGHVAPQVKTSKASTAQAPLDLPKEGILLGLNKHRNVETEVFMSPEDRLRHFYIIGQTGTGKTTILKNMIVQDIKNGEGVCMIDPHGSDIVEVLAQIPRERYDDIIYFDPSHVDRPMALNMLEYDVRYPEQKTFVVNEMLAIFNKLFDMKVAGGPAFEQYFRNSALLVMEHPESGNTLLDISRVLSDKAFRELKLANCKNPLVKQFWENAAKTTGEQGLSNYVPYITNKFDVFLSNDIMRPIVSQEKSSFNFREIMDNKKILLVNLAKGRLGDINSSLLGLIIVGKLLMAALSRVDSMGSKDMPPFYLYIDEFQNVTTDSISTILSEARKYKLSLTMAHQFIAQLEQGIRDSVFGNVGSMAVFRVGAEDAEFFEKQFSPMFTSKDIMNLDNHNAYVKMLSHGRLVKPFNMENKLNPRPSLDKVENLKELSYLKYGEDRDIVEEAVMLKYKKEPIPQPPLPPKP